MNKLRVLRERSDMSLRELGKELDMNASVLGNYERGDRNPKTEVWEKIARYFNVSVPYIMGLDTTNENMVSISKVEYEYLKNIEKQLEQIKQLLK